MNPTEVTASVDNDTGEEPGVIPAQSKAKALLSSVKSAINKYLVWSKARTGLIMLQPKAPASQATCDSPNTDAGHQDGTRLDPATSSDIHTRVKDPEVTPAKTIAQVPQPTIQSKVKPRDSSDVTLVRDDDHPRLKLPNTVLSPKDKMTKHESKTDFLHKILKDFVCIFQIFRVFSEIEAK